MPELVIRIRNLGVVIRTSNDSDNSGSRERRICSNHDVCHNVSLLIQ
jgi:hypothetical protein